MGYHLCLRSQRPLYHVSTTMRTPFQRIVNNYHRSRVHVVNDYIDSVDYLDTLILEYFHEFELNFAIPFQPVH